MPIERASPMIGRVLGGTYRLEALLGEGGMGAVYEASHSRVRRRFAVKLLSAEVASNEQAFARFRREAEVTSELGHPNIIEVIDFNQTEDGIPYLVMERLVGEDLEARLARTRRMPLTAAAAIVRQVASALQAAHEHNVIHRDLKPSNIFLCQRDGDDDFVKVLDFGISKVMGSRSLVTRTHATLGTPSYMSPEQAEGRAAEVDPRTDIFALGTILYEMVTGSPPFVGESIPTVLYRIVHSTPTRPLELRGDLPLPVEAVIQRALEKKPEQRFATMQQLSAALEQALTGGGLATARTMASIDGGPTEVESAAARAAPGPATAPAGVVAAETPAAPQSLNKTTLSEGAGESHRPPVDVPRRFPLRAAVIATAVLAAVALIIGIGSIDRGRPRRSRPHKQPTRVGPLPAKLAANPDAGIARGDGPAHTSRPGSAVDAGDARPTTATTTRQARATATTRAPATTTTARRDAGTVSARPPATPAGSTHPAPPPAAKTKAPPAKRPRRKGGGDMSDWEFP